MSSRREFLKSSAAAGFLLGAAAPSASSALRPFFGKALGPLVLNPNPAESQVTPDLVRFTPEVEPIVQLIEETPREKCFEMMVEQLRLGLPYRNFLAALFLAGIRNVNPQPPGFKFHCVMAIHSANQLSLDAMPQDRLLPLFWALDQFKKSQAEDVQQGDFQMRTIQGPLPSPEKAAAEFHAAMQAWDPERAGRAVVAFVRTRGADEIIEAFWRYGARDFRHIGHKGIFVANSWRTLQVIGWQHAEPVMRSLVLALLDVGNARRSNGTFDDPAYLTNVEGIRKTLPTLPGDWTGSAANEGATRDLLDATRGGDIASASRTTLQQLASGKMQSQAVWDAVHLAAGELMMRQPGILGIHTVTSANSLHYAFRTASDSETRLLMLLQGVAWMCQFRNMMASRRDKLGKTKITELAPQRVDENEVKGAEEVLAKIGPDMPGAAARAFSYAQQHPEAQAYSRLARRLIFRKGTDAHHYKYAAAIFEDYGLVSPIWRPHQLATSVYYFRGTSEPDSKVMTRALAAVKNV